MIFFMRCATKRILDEILFNFYIDLQLDSSPHSMDMAAMGGNI